MNMNKLIVAAFAMFLILPGCTSLVEGSLRSSLVGTWEAIQVVDDATGNIVDKEEGGFIFTLFEDISCDAINLEDDGNFNTFYTGVSGGTIENGSWEYAFLDLTLTFDNGKTLIRQISINEDILTLPDTIGGVAKSVVFQRQ